MELAWPPLCHTRRVLLNIDAGELATEPDELYALAHLVNVACGGHAGDDASMRRAISLAIEHGTLIGAHPSYDDRARFGRHSLIVDPTTLAASLIVQCAMLARHGAALSARVTHVKPHGALYHDATRSPEIARVVFDAAEHALGDDITFVGASGGALHRHCLEKGARFLSEVFADRGVYADGSLIPRDQPGALITDADLAAARARDLISQKIADTLCVHGDTPGALSIARAVRSALDESSVTPQPTASA